MRIANDAKLQQCQDDGEQQAHERVEDVLRVWCGLRDAIVGLEEMGENVVISLL